MNLIEKITNKLGFISSAQYKRTCTILVYLFLVTGCNMNNALIAEMETAYKLPSKSSTESNKQVTDIIGKRFHKGMKVVEVLEELSTKEFAIYEYTLSGVRLWPKGDLEPYPNYVDDDKSRNIRKKHYIEKQIDYRAEFSYWPSPLEKRDFVIVIETNDNLIVKSSGAIYIQTL